MVSIKSLKHVKLFCCSGNSVAPFPAHYLLSDGGKVLETEEGKILVTEILGENEMLFTDYRPKKDTINNTVRTTSVEADDPNDPTNWVTFDEQIFTNLPAGRYQGSVSFSWKIDTTSKYAIFRSVLGGQANRSIKIESKDTEINHVEHWEITFDWGGGDIQVDMDYLISAGALVNNLTVDRTWMLIEKIS